MKLDLYGRIVRTIRCQMRKYYGKRWEKVTPADFYENPERVTALWYAFREGRMPDFKHPTDFNERLMALNLQAFRDETQWPIRPVEGNGLFSTILDITQTLSKFELTADQIFFDQNKDITLYFGDVRVQIGAGDNLDDKFAKIQSILPELEGKKGVLHMADYTSDSRNITFESDDNLGQ